MEMVPWLVEHGWSGLWSFVLEISCWMMLHSWVDQLKLTVIKLRQWDQRYGTQEIANILKISKSSTENLVHQLGYVHHFDVWVSHKLSEKTFLPIFPYAILYLNVTKDSFEKQSVMGDEKWILYNNVEQQRSWGKMNHHQTQQRPVFIQRRWSQRRDWKGVFYNEFLWKTKLLTPTGTVPN